MASRGWSDEDIENMAAEMDREKRIARCRAADDEAPDRLLYLDGNSLTNGDAPEFCSLLAQFLDDSDDLVTRDECMPVGEVAGKLLMVGPT